MLFKRKKPEPVPVWWQDLINEVISAIINNDHDSFDGVSDLDERQNTFETLVNCLKIEGVEYVDLPEEAWRKVSRLQVAKNTWIVEPPFWTSLGESDFRLVCEVEETDEDIDITVNRITC